MENASNEFIEKIALLCNPNLNLDNSLHKALRPNEGFQLFMTYNPEGKYSADNILNKLFDKCLVYYLDSFINNEQALSEIIYGFLINLSIRIYKVPPFEISLVIKCSP